MPSAVVLEMATRRARLRLVPTGDAVITERASGHSDGETTPLEVADLRDTRDGPFYFVGAIPKGTYPGVDHDVSAVAAETLFVAHELMPEDIAYEITKVLLERSRELASVSGVAREITPVTAGSRPTASRPTVSASARSSTIGKRRGGSSTARPIGWPVHWMMP
jgi:TRAP-type uncharacterized transport system substrate-binding protein